MPGWSSAFAQGLPEALVRRCPRALLGGLLRQTGARASRASKDAFRRLPGRVGAGDPILAVQGQITPRLAWLSAQADQQGPERRAGQAGMEHLGGEPARERR